MVNALWRDAKVGDVKEALNEGKICSKVVFNR